MIATSDGSALRQLKAVLTYWRPTSEDEEEKAQKTITVFAGTPISFGRDLSSSVRLLDPWVSSSHLKFEIDEEANELKVHTSGRNGAWVIRNGLEQLVKEDTVTGLNDDTWYIRGSNGNYRINVLLGGQTEDIKGLKNRLAGQILMWKAKVDKLDRQNTTMFATCIKNGQGRRLELLGDFEFESDEAKVAREKEEAQLRVMELERLIQGRKIYWAKQERSLNEGTEAKASQFLLDSNKRLRAEKDETRFKIRRLEGIIDPTLTIPGHEVVESDHFLSYEEMRQVETKLHTEAENAEKEAKLRELEREEKKKQRLAESTATISKETLPALPMPPGSLNSQSPSAVITPVSKPLTTEQLAEAQKLLDSDEEDFDMNLAVSVPESLTLKLPTNESEKPNPGLEPIAST